MEQNQFTVRRCLSSSIPVKGFTGPPVHTVIADKTGTHRDVLSDWEPGTPNASFVNIENVTAALSMKLSDLIGTVTPGGGLPQEHDSRGHDRIL